MRMTRSSSALRMAQPSDGSASTSSRLPASMASMEPARERCTPRTAVTTPMLGPGQARQQGDLAGGVEAHLEDGHLVLRAQPQQGHGQADLVVPVGRVAQHLEVLLEDLRDLLLGRGLGQRAGDAHDQRREAIAIGGRDRTQRQRRVRHTHDRHPAGRREGLEPIWLELRAHHQCRRTGLDRGLEEAVSVGAFAGQGEEGHALADGPGIDGATADGGAPTAQQLTARGRCQPGGIELHRGVGHRRRDRCLALRTLIHAGPS